MTPHPGRIKLLNYIKKEFPWKHPFIYIYKEDNKALSHEFSWDQVEKAKRWAKSINTENYNILLYLTTSQRTRQGIADALFLDMTTVKRRADKCLDQIMHYLVAVYVNKEDFDLELQPIDLRAKLEKDMD